MPRILTCSFPYFGLEGLVNELETSFRPSINTLKSDDYEQTNDDACNAKLLMNLKKCSYIYIQTAGRCESTVTVKKSIPQAGLQMSVLEDYIKVGNESKIRISKKTKSKSIQIACRKPAAAFSLNSSLNDPPEST